MNFPNFPVRRLLGAMALGLAVAVPASAANIEGPKVFWKISMWGKARALSVGMEELAKRAATETGGNFHIKIFYGEQLSKVKENLDGLKLNAFEGAAFCNFYHPGKNPALMVFSLPFLPLGDPKVDKYVRSRMFEHPVIVAEMAKWNAMPYVSGLLPQYEIMGKGPVPETLEGWKGLRVRAGGGLGEAMEKAAVGLDFEMAAVYRDRLKALTFIQGNQAINAQGRPRFSTLSSLKP